MDRQPVLTGDRLLLRPLMRGDWNALYAVACDPLVWEQHPAHDRWREEVFRAFFEDALDKGGALAVIDRATDAVIGSSRYQGYDGTQSIVEIGWTFLARANWGGACNRELKQLMLAHAFRWVETVELLVGADNLRSRRAVEKIGGKLREHRALRRPMGAMPHVIYEITRGEYAAGPLVSQA